MKDRKEEMNTQLVAEDSDDFQNMMRDYDGNLIPVTGWFCGICLLPLYTPEEIGRSLHWHCTLTG
jgi:hypothetical protein